MARDIPEANETPKPVNGAPSNGREEAETRVTSADTDLESERDSLKKARESDLYPNESEGVADGYGNLHFGDQPMDDEQNGAGRIRDGGYETTSLDAGERGRAEAGAENAGSEDSNDLESFVDDALTNAPEINANDQSSSPADSDGVAVAATAGAAASAPAGSGLGAPQGVSARSGEPAGAEGKPFGEQSPVNEAPTEILLSAASAAENASGAVIASLSAVDPDADDTAVFAIASDESGLFEIVGDELKLKAGAAFDFEAQDSYVITLRVTDSAGNVFEKPVTINVTDVNEAPDGLALSGADLVENVDGAIVGTLSATDPDFGDAMSYFLAEDASGLFEIVGDELRLKSGAATDFEAQDSYEVTLLVTDRAGNTFSKPVTINVADVNEAPLDIMLSANNIDENNSGATVGTLSAVDPDSGDAMSYSIAEDASGLFEIVGDELRLKPGAAADFEAQDTHQITLNVTDSAGASYQEIMTINVADINEAPTDVLLSANMVAENDAGATVGTLSAIDPDFGDSAGFAIANDASGLFEIVGDTLKLKPGAAVDFEAQDAFEITVQATDSAGASFEKIVTVNASDINEAPQTISLSSTSVAENSDGGVVGTIATFDPDAGDTISYAVSDDRFEVVGDQLKLKSGVSLDYETAEPIDVTITATDSGGLTSVQDFTLTVADANDAPMLSFVSNAGLKASYFDIGHSLSNLDEIDFDATPDAPGVVDPLNYMQGQEAFWEGAPADYFAAKYEGQIIVEEGGTYTFSMASDDGSMMFIDGVPVLDNDGLHGTTTRTVTLDLESGAHDIEIRYFENGGSQTLQLAWSGPDTGGATEVIGGDSYAH